MAPTKGRRDWQGESSICPPPQLHHHPFSAVNPTPIHSHNHHHLVTIIATEITFWRWRAEGPIFRCNPSLPKHHTEMIDFSHTQIVVFPRHASPHGHVIHEWNLFWFRSYLNFDPPVPLRWLNNFILFHFWKLLSRGSHFDSSPGQTGTNQG